MKRVLLIFAMILMACSSAPALTPQQVVDGFKKAGLPVGEARTIAAQDYGAAPKVCDGVIFPLTALKDANGRAFVCKTNEDRDRLAGYYRELGKASALFFSHVYVKGSVVLQLNGELPEADARRFEGALP